MRKRYLAAAVAVLSVWLGACGRRRAAAPAVQREPRGLVVLLPDPRGLSGWAKVTNGGVTQQLEANYTAVRVAGANTAPEAPEAIDPAEAQRIFGAALDALPAEEMTFTLHFRLGTTDLAAESEALLPALLRAARERQSTIISVTGHTDTTGPGREYNYKLGLERAEAVAARLRSIGIDPGGIRVRSHGQDEPAVSRAAGTPEEKNRRVEVILH